MFKVSQDVQNLLPGRSFKTPKELAETVTELHAIGKLTETQRSFIIGSTIAPLLKQADEQDRRAARKRRYDAAKVRETVVVSSGGICQCCGFDCEPIIEMHHIKALSDGGNSELGNLICLCPNCHSVIEKLKRCNVSDDLAKLYRWMHKTYSKRVADNIKRVASGWTEHADLYEVFR